MDFGTRMATVASLIGFHSPESWSKFAKMPLRLSLPPVEVSADTRFVAARLSQYARSAAYHPAEHPDFQVPKDSSRLRRWLGDPMVDFDQTSVASERNNTLWWSGVADCWGVSEAHG